MEEDYKRYQAQTENWPFKLIVILISCGYLTGICLTLIWYEAHPALKKCDLDQRWLVLVIVVLLCTTLLFSRFVRCILLLALPSLSSSRGRALLITLAFAVAALGPTANIVSNLSIILQSLACTQELLRQAIGQMLDVVMEPVHAVQAAIGLLLEEMRHIVQHVSELLLRIQGYLQSIIAVLKRCFGWLKSVVELCNSERGTPYTLCQQAAQRALDKCRAKMGVFQVLCEATKLFFALCYPAKLVDVFCSAVWDAHWDLLDTIQKRYQQFVEQLEEMFDVSISFEHVFSFHTNASRNLSDVAAEILNDVSQDLGPLLLVRSWLDLLCWIMLLVILFKAFYFYVRYMLSRGYQNVYLTSAFYAIDNQRQAKGERSLLPLKRLERGKYLQISSLRLTRAECVKLAENSLFMLITCVQLGIICLVDYSLFWLLDAIAYYGQEQAELEVPAYVDLEIEGGGIVGDIMRGMANAFRPMTQRSTVNSKDCLPLPLEPNYMYYLGILTLCLLAWLVIWAEPYMLRLRHIIMQSFYPERAHVRALHLYNRISGGRATLFNIARRRARAAFRYQDAGHQSGCLGWLCYCCCCVCGWIGLRGAACIMCSKRLSSSTRIQCATPACKGVYCQLCFEGSRKKCCLCQRPVDCGDDSDFEDVLDSSDDSQMESYGQLQRRIYCAKYSKQKVSKTHEGNSKKEHEDKAANKNKPNRS